MPLTIGNPKDFWSGAIFIGFGLTALYIGQDYSMGTTGRMGPGYFPMILGALLSIVGAFSILRSLYTRGEAISGLTVRRAALILGSTVLFGLIVRGAGLPIAIILVVLISGLASDQFRFYLFLLVAVLMAIVCTLVFVVGLSLPIPTTGTWFGSEG